MNLTDTYVKELGECLKKESIDELRKFVQKYSGLFDPVMVKHFSTAPNGVIEITLYKMIYSRTDLPEKLREKAKKWLLDRNYTAGIREVLEDDE